MTDDKPKAEKTEPSENNPNKENYDLIIIGAGAAGLTAAIYAARYRLKFLVITKETGGMTATAHKICNFPSYHEINGVELMQKFEEHAKGLGAKIVLGTVVGVKKQDDGFSVHTESNSIYGCKKVIFAAGTERRKLGIPNEERFIGRGVSYCATCDGAFFKNRIAGVIGGSDAALTAALLLAEFCTKVYIIYRKESFRAEPAWVELVKNNSKIEPVFNEEVTGIIGDKLVKEVKLKSGKELKLDGLFIEIGSVPNISITNPLGVKDENGYIITDHNQMTNIEGFYAAGDIVKAEPKQIVVAAAHGAIAAHSVYKEIARHGKA